ncbi:MAG: pyridoxamine 5-phosphate oxidase [Paracoccus sp. (in: a-proteobacteria)]
MMTDPIQKTDDYARQLTRDLLSRAQHGVLSVSDMESDFPHLARIAVQTDSTGIPLAFLSEIAVHTQILEKQPRAGLLIGASSQRGDAMAQARLSLQVTACRLPDHGPEHTARIDTWIAHNPKARVYACLPGFCFWHLNPHGGLLNAGFGKAFRLRPEDIMMPPEQSVREH